MRASSDRLEEEWRLLRCSDCDPDNAGGEPEYPVPYVLMVPMGVDAPDNCPRCGNYLSLCDAADHLRITNTPAERWASSRAESVDAVQFSGTLAQRRRARDLGLRLE